MEKLATKDISGETFALRTHHLTLWQDLTEGFKKYYGKGSTPWSMPGKDFSDFILGYAFNQLEIETKFQRFHKKTFAALGLKDDAEAYVYYNDLIGEDDKTRSEVLNKRIKVYKDFLTFVQKSKDQKIILTANPDPYCRTCAVGNHCQIFVPDDFNNDVIFKNVLNEFLKTENGNLLKKTGMMGITKEGELFITAELIFDPDFYSIFPAKIFV